MKHYDVVQRGHGGPHLTRPSQCDQNLHYQGCKKKIHEAFKSCDTSGAYFNVGKTLHQTFPSVNWNKKGAQLKKKSLFRTLDS